MQDKCRVHIKGYTLKKVAEKAAKIFSIDATDIFKPGQQIAKVQARSLLFYWATQELGMSMTSLAKKLHIFQPSVSISTRRGERIAQDNEYLLVDE